MYNVSFIHVCMYHLNGLNLCELIFVLTYIRQQFIFQCLPFSKSGSEDFWLTPWRSVAYSNCWNQPRDQIFSGLRRF